MVGIEMKQKVTGVYQSIARVNHRVECWANGDLSSAALLPATTYEQIDHLVEVLTEVLSTELCHGIADRNG